MRLLLFIFFLAAEICAQTTGVFSGSIKDEQGDPLMSANIKLIETRNGSASDRYGRFEILAKPGVYQVEISYLGYEKITDQITITEGGKTEKNYSMRSTSFTIGTIYVTAENDFLPIAPETKTKVTSSEIEHMQASSLNDVMKLTPGVETTNPTLNNVEKASIRSGDALGTQIILDGIPMTNNANMQIGIGYSSANSGVDLRSIPAENIKEVDIVRGIPSAQYGDLVDGLLIVKTKASADPLKSKIKYNPQLYEFNLSGGFRLSDWVANVNFNLASSDRDIRLKGDGYTRIAGQVSLENSAESFELKNVLYITRAFDEYKEQPGYALRDAWYNRDLNIKYTLDYSRIYTSFNRLSARLSLSYTKQNSYSQQLVSRDNIVLSDLEFEGTKEGRIVFGSYLGQKYIKGDVWNIYTDVSHNLKFFTGELLNSFLYGLTFRNDFNKGDGIVFDPLFPPSAVTTTPRLRNYSSIPAYSILSLYAEDKLTGNVGYPFILQFGARYEVYRPNGFDIKGLYGGGDLIKSHNGSFLNPRINFSMNIFKDSQIRLGYGTTSKSPPMGMIYADKKYFDIVDTVSVVNPQYPDSNYSLISTYIREQANSEIKGYTQKKYEISFDQQFDFAGFTITGYYNDTRNMFQRLEEPVVLYKKSFPAGLEGQSIIKDTILNTYSQYANNGWLKSSGIEFSLSTIKIPVVNTIFKFDAAYIYTENGEERGTYYSSPRYVNELGLDVIPIYNEYNNYNKDLLLNYRFDIQAKELGIWLTLHLQQKVLEIDGRAGYDDILPVGFYSSKGELTIIPQEERSNPKYTSLRRTIQDFELLEEIKPNKWLFNLKVSKSLWPGAAVSFYVNNFFNNQPLYKVRRSSPSSPSYERRNPDIFYGLDLSTAL